MFSRDQGQTQRKEIVLCPQSIRFKGFVQWADGQWSREDGGSLELSLLKNKVVQWTSPSVMGESVNGIRKQSLAGSVRRWLKVTETF